MPDDTRKRLLWRCIICGYVAEGSAPPALCPVCGATSDFFEPYEFPTASPAAR